MEKGVYASEPEGFESNQERGGFSTEERAAMKERAQELKAESRRGARSKQDGEHDVLAKIAGMPEPDRDIALRLHEIVGANAPSLRARSWYGMPAYALDGKIVLFFQSAKEFNSRYSTIGFNDAANLDEGDMWATSFALMRLTPAVEEAIAELIRKAVGRSSE